MDLAKDINDHFFLWIRKVEANPERRPYLWGSFFEGVEVLLDNTRKYFGPLALISEHSAWQGEELFISKGHMSRRGSFWGIGGEAEVSYPETPFLITSHLAMRFIRRQEVSFVLTDGWEFNDENESVEEYMLWQPHWLGVLYVDKKVSSSQGSLLIFSDQPEVEIAAHSPVFFGEAPEECFAKISPL